MLITWRTDSKSHWTEFKSDVRDRGCLIIRKYFAEQSSRYELSTSCRLLCGLILNLIEQNLDPMYRSENASQSENISRTSPRYRI